MLCVTSNSIICLSAGSHSISQPCSSICSLCLSRCRTHWQPCPGCTRLGCCRGHCCFDASCIDRRRRLALGTAAAAAGPAAAASCCRSVPNRLPGSHISCWYLMLQLCCRMLMASFFAQSASPCCWPLFVPACVPTCQTGAMAASASNGMAEPPAATPGLVWGWPVGPPVPWFAGMPATYMHASVAGRHRGDCMAQHTPHAWDLWPSLTFSYNCFWDARRWHSIVSCLTQVLHICQVAQRRCLLRPTPWAAGSQQRRCTLPRPQRSLWIPWRPCSSR